MMYYALKSALLLTLLYGGFSVLLSRETFHRFNRLMLLGIMLLSLILPAVHVTTSRPAPIVLDKVIRSLNSAPSHGEEEGRCAQDDHPGAGQATLLPAMREAEGEVVLRQNILEEKDFWGI